MIRLCAWIMFFSTLLAASGKTVRISVYPQQANLTGDHTRQSLLVMAVDDEGVERDVTAKAAYTTTPAGIVRVTTDFAVEALADGAASLRVAYGGSR